MATGLTGKILVAYPLSPTRLASGWLTYFHPAAEYQLDLLYAFNCLLRAPAFAVMPSVTTSESAIRLTHPTA